MTTLDDLTETLKLNATLDAALKAYQLHQALAQHTSAVAAERRAEVAQLAADWGSAFEVLAVRAYETLIAAAEEEPTGEASSSGSASSGSASSGSASSGSASSGSAAPPSETFEDEADDGDDEPSMPVEWAARAVPGALLASLSSSSAPGPTVQTEGLQGAAPQVSLPAPQPPAAPPAAPPAKRRPGRPRK